MASRNDKNLLERRLREVDQSRTELRAEIKRLERALRNPERLLQRPQLLPTTAPITPRVRPAATTAAPAPEPVHAVPAVPVPTAPVASERHIPVSRNETFARYFSSTRFFGPPTLGHARHIQRNRAVFWLIFALVFAFLVIKYIASKT